jgi:predicted HTH domain antitoxin
MSKVKVELTSELFTLAEVEGSTPSRAAAKLIALELFRENRVSLGKGAELAGVSAEEFMEFAAERNVPLHYTIRDWEADHAVARKPKP